MEKGLNSLPKEIREDFGISQKDIREYSPLTLAFIGDGIYDLIIRTIVTQKGNRPANMLNKMKVKLVNAAAQARIIDKLIESEALTEEEMTIYKRGRNAKSYTSAKNQSVGDYRKATGLEALCGYLYLTDRTDRILELVKMEIMDD